METLPQWPNQVWADNALAIADHLRMNRVVYERGDRLSVGSDRLNHMTTRIIQLLGVIVVRDLSFGFIGGDFQNGRLELARGFVNRFGHFCANTIQVFQIRSRGALLIRKAVAVWCAMRVCCPNQNVLCRNSFNLRTCLVPEQRGKTQKIRANDCHVRLTLRQHQRPNLQITFLARRRMRRSNAA